MQFSNCHSIEIQFTDVGLKRYEDWNKGKMKAKIHDVDDEAPTAEDDKNVAFALPKSVPAHPKTTHPKPETEQVSKHFVACETVARHIQVYFLCYFH